LTPETLLLCTDLDRTVLPNGTQPESPKARRCFSRFVSESDVILVYVTGRNKSLVQRAMVNYRLPTPDFVISDVGTNIHDLRTGDWQVWLEWQKEIGRDWKGRTHQELRQLLRDIDALRLQEHAKQNTYKLSFYVPLSADRATLRRVIEARLTDAGVEAGLIFSIDEPGGVGLLDILPRRATKLHAIEFLQQYLCIPLEQVLFAGDSGNDLAVLASRIPAVLVANAMASVVEEATVEARKQHNESALYVARGGYLGMNGNYSAGILEGIAHYHPDLRTQIGTIEPEQAHH
jgi:sucrose-6F-phosphate phosphohydrolase